VSGIDPQLVDPENGDYRVARESPAEGYGCQTFAARAQPPEPATARPAPHFSSGHRDVVDVSGSISVNTVWSADTVRVVGDVTVEEGVTLTIDPGVRVEFQDYYKLDVAGTLVAIGTPSEQIVFTTDEPQAFVVDGSHAGCWDGIRFDETLSTNAPSHLAYCVIEYSKASGGGGLYPYGGGAISVVDFSGLTVENCVLRRNAADYGGAVFLYRNAGPKITGNLIVDNHALENASAIYCAYSYPEIVNNTIVGNMIHNLEDPYIESCAVLNFLSKGVFTNNIIRDNDPDFVYLHSQLWHNKAYYTHYNNIEDYDTSGDNLDADPLFVPGPVGCYYLSQTAAGQSVQSPCVDAGGPASSLIDGTTRSDEVLDAGVLDMGYHYPISGLPLVMGDANRDLDVDLDDFAEAQRCFTGAGPGEVTPCCRIFDYEPDDDVDLDDMAALAAALTGP
jgi:hypothetical protein